jgi:hypothetical protein
MDELARRIDADFAERLAAQPGFVSYEMMDCGLGEFMTMSVFDTLEQAEASREMARQWAEENADLSFPRLEAAHGEIHVGRVVEAHAGDASKPVTVRRFCVTRGSVGELMERVDELDGFVFDCGGDEILWVSFPRDLDAAVESDERFSRVVKEDLRDFGLERRLALRGSLLVSRA